ncbi:MAG: glycosyltransferase family 2 protein [Burkholderiales bacterium]|nr:glycosyltransferase family 2 protein [Burkholderiales bacterium]
MGTETLPAARPSFSIVISNYNYGRYVGAAIGSCLAQEYPADLVEVIVVDDGSTDESRATLERYAADPRVRLAFQPNRGQGAAFAAGVELARGDFVCLLDADDFYRPQKLDRVARRLARLSPGHAGVLLCHDAELYDERTGAVTGQTWFEVVGIRGPADCAHLSQVEQQFPFAIPCGQVYSRGLIARVLSSLSQTEWRMGVDSPLAHSALLATEFVHYLDEPLACYRVHGTNDGATLVAGRYLPRRVWHPRVAPMLRHLERFLDTLSLDPRERAARLAYIKRKERTIPAVSAARRLREPLVSFIVGGAEGAAGIERSAGSVRRQTHRGCETVIVSDTGGSGGHPWRRWRAGYGRAGGEFVTFLSEACALDPGFAECHLRAHAHGALVNVTCCDARLVDAAGNPAGSTVVPERIRATQRAGHRPPLAGSFAETWFPPAPAMVMRRTALIDALFEAGADSPGEAARVPLPLAACQLLHGTGGSLMIPDALLELRSPAREAAVAASTREAFAAALAVLLFGAYCGAFPLLSSALPGSWHERFLQRVIGSAGEGAGRRLAAIARLKGAPEPLVALLETQP